MGCVLPGLVGELGGAVPEERMRPNHSAACEVCGMRVSAGGKVRNKFRAAHNLVEAATRATDQPPLSQSGHRYPSMDEVALAPNCTLKRAPKVVRAAWVRVLTRAPPRRPKQK